MTIVTGQDYGIAKFIHPYIQQEAITTIRSGIINGTKSAFVKAVLNMDNTGDGVFEYTNEAYYVLGEKVY